MKVFNESNDVIGSVQKVDGAYRASWLVPKGYFREGDFLFIGEYQSKDLAINSLFEFLEKRQVAIEKNDIEREKMLEDLKRKDKIVWIMFALIIVSGLVALALLSCKTYGA